MNSIYLIRHGMTQANEQHLYCGSTDIALSDRGVEELKKLHYDIPDCRFVTSGMKRTEQTLQLLFGSVPHSQLIDFREIDFGIFEMHNYEQLKDCPAYQNWISGDNDSNIPPNGESSVQMKRRVIHAFQSLYPSKEDIVVITHGGVIAIIMESLFPEENKNRYQWQPAPGHGYMLSDGCFRPIP